MLPVSLPSLLVQDYPGDARIILVDDCSSDGTGRLARELAARYGGLPLTVVTPGEPERGWTGKLWALRHGIAVARREKPDFLLLTDADIAHEPDSLRDLVAAKPPRARTASTWCRRWRGFGWRASGSVWWCPPSSTSSGSSTRSAG